MNEHLGPSQEEQTGETESSKEEQYAEALIEAAKSEGVNEDVMRRIHQQAWENSMGSGTWRDREQDN